jgi:hypothetical protein
MAEFTGSASVWAQIAKMNLHFPWPVELSTAIETNLNYE